MTFPVDDVVPAVQLLATRPLGELVVDAIVVGGDPATPVLSPDGVHPLLSAVGHAFAEHRPLVLSPDAVWLTIAAGVAQHVRLHAEALRPRLVRHAGRKRLEVTVFDTMPRDERSWRAVAASLATQLADQVDDAEVFECDFSTSTEVERMAGRVVLLDVYAPYFSRWLWCVCGIPSVTLTGTVADWQRIRDRVDRLARFGLDTWCQSLVPITDELVRAAGGDADIGFWRRIYNPADAYGGAVITGWAARLYPYLCEVGGIDRPNPLLQLPIDQPKDLTVARMGAYRGPGVRSDAVPAALSRVVVTVNDRVGGENTTVALHAGLVGVAQDADGALRPIAGWHLAPAQIEIDDVIDRLVREHEAAAPESDRMIFGTAELLAVYDRVGAATLFDGAWRLLPAAEHGDVSRGDDCLDVVTIMRIPDGRCIAAAVDDAGETLHWIVCRVEDLGPDPSGLGGRIQRLLDDPADIPVYGTSLALILQTILDGEDLTELATGRLVDLDAVQRRRSTTVPTAPSASEDAVSEPGPQAGIEEIRAAKETAVDQQHFELAARLREREKALQCEQTNHGRTGPSQA